MRTYPPLRPFTKLKLNLAHKQIHATLFFFSAINDSDLSAM